MKFLDYIKSLMSVFSKDDIVKSCELTQSSLSQHTIPAYAAAVELWKGKKFKSSEIRDYVAYYERSVGVNRTENMVGSIHNALVNSLNILNALADDSKVTYSEKEANISMTYLKVTTLRIIEAAEYANTYSRCLLNYIYYLETIEVNGDKKPDDITPEEEAQAYYSGLSPAEIKWLKDGLMDFCLCIKVMSMDVSVIRKHLENLPNANITELTEKTFSTTIGTGKLDPFELRHFSAKVNPFYLYGMFKAEKQAKKYKAAKTQVELIQLRKYNLEKQYNKEPDAKLEKEIAYMQNRLSGLIFEVEEMEKEYVR